MAEAKEPGLVRLRRGVADAAGWTFCEEHKRARCPLHPPQRMADRAEEGTVWPEQGSDAGQCQYCGTATRVKPDPFGNNPACRPCFFQIIDGET